MITLEDWVDIKNRKRSGRSIREIARQTGLSRNTVRRYLRGQSTPQYSDRPKKPSLLDPYKDYLKSRVEKLPELPATVLLREIRARGYTGQITVVKDFVRPLRAERRRLEELTVRFETEPGEQAQIDWGEFGRLPDGRKLYALSVVLGFSRTLFVHFTCRMVVQELLYALVLAFEYFGGLPRKLLFDNPKTVVLVRGATVRESTLHPRFLDFLGHYALELQLCEPRRPRTKGKVERPMRYIATSLVLPGFEHWTSPEDANREARLWLESVAQVRVHGTTRERPCERLPREQLTPLTAVRPYDLSWSEPRRVQRDCHFSWEGNFYSVPWQHGSTAVLVRRSPEGRLEVERAGEIIATHRERLSGRGEHITLAEHGAGLWQKTLGRKQTHAAPAERADLALPAETQQIVPLSLLHATTALESAVEQRDLAVYQELLEAAPQTGAVPAAEVAA
jgi:transposase